MSDRLLSDNRKITRVFLSSIHIIIITIIVEVEVSIIVLVIDFGAEAFVSSSGEISLADSPCKQRWKELTSREEAFLT